MTVDPFAELERITTSGGPSYFSQNRGNDVAFKFPERALGSLQYWASATEGKKVKAESTVQVPRGAKVTLFTGEPLLMHPALWNKFRPDDLCGIEIIFSQAIRADKLDDAVDTIMQITRKQVNGHVPKAWAESGGVKRMWAEAEKQININELQDPNLKSQNLNAALTFDNLRLLALLYGDFTERQWLHMGTMSDLRWIWLDACHLNGKKPRGDDLARLANLNGLKVISIDRLDAPAAMLKQLEHSTALRRLSLGDVPMARQDFALIAKIPNLETLRLRNLMLAGDTLLEELDKAPHLERLALGNVQIKRTEQLSGLFKLKHLKELVVDYPEGSKEFQAIKVAPGCRVYSRAEAHCNWFDWTVENPDITGLW